ncbi:hypothetical protein HOE425_331804 [Hoeflea sp. EC-HK425]|nr:hypothetical protein HOE425_331804 [Hoeflea sp. EC-HK425]
MSPPALSTARIEVQVMGLSHHEIVEIDTKGGCDALEHIDRASLLAVFDIGEVGLGNARGCGKLGSGHAAILAIGADAAVGFHEFMHEFGRPGLFARPDALKDRVCLEAVHHVFIVLFTDENVGLAVNGHFLDFTHRQSLLVDAATRACADHQDDNALVVDDDAVLAYPDAVQVRPGQLFDINLFAARECIHLGENGRAPLRLHPGEAFFRCLGIDDPLHPSNIALSYTSVNHSLAKQTLH